MIVNIQDFRYCLCIFILDVHVVYGFIVYFTTIILMLLTYTHLVALHLVFYHLTNCKVFDNILFFVIMLVVFGGN